jgi:hypothetical protein
VHAEQKLTGWQIDCRFQSMPRNRETLDRSFEVEALMRVFAFASVIWLAALGHLVPAQSRTFGGFICSHECELHSAGYKWARDRSIHDKPACPYGISGSFHQGCVSFIQNPARDPDKDDQGNSVGVFVERPDNE